MIKTGEIDELLKHVSGESRRMKTYYLTEKGIVLANKVMYEFGKDKLDEMLTKGKSFDAIEKMFEEHHNPDVIYRTCVPCFPFGPIYVLWGKPGLIFPVDRYIEIGLKRRDDSKQSVRKVDPCGTRKYGPNGESCIIPKHKRSRLRVTFRELVNGESKISGLYKLYEKSGVFEDEKEYKSYFDSLLKFDYSIIADSGVARGLSLAGTVSTILAAIALREVGGYKKYPFNNPNLSSNQHEFPVWAFPEYDEEKPVSDFLVGGEKELFRKFIALSQIFEAHWNFPFERYDIESDSSPVLHFMKKTKMLNYSSGGSSLSTIFNRPVKVCLSNKDGIPDFETSIICKSSKASEEIGMIIDYGGERQEPKNIFWDVIERFGPLLDNEETEDNAEVVLGNLKQLSETITNITWESKFWEDNKRKGVDYCISTLIVMQSSMHKFLGVENLQFDELKRELLDQEKELEISLTPIGTGDGSIFFYCLGHPSHLDVVKKYIKDMTLLPDGKSKKPRQRFEIMQPLKKGRSLFNGKLLSLYEKPG